MTMAGWLSLLLCYAGFAALACAMPRHFAQITGRRGAPLRPRLWQGAGALLLALSLWAALDQWGRGLGLTAWAGILTLAGLALGLLLTGIEERAPRLLLVLPALLVAGFMLAAA